MNRQVVLLFLAGLLGGLVSRYVMPPSAYAQTKPSVAKEIRAQSFTLVDQSGRPAGTFTTESSSVPARPRIVLRDPSGRELWSAGGTGLQPLTAK